MLTGFREVLSFRLGFISFLIYCIYGQAPFLNDPVIASQKVHFNNYWPRESRELYCNVLGFFSDWVKNLGLVRKSSFFFNFLNHLTNGLIDSSGSTGKVVRNEEVYRMIWIPYVCVKIHAIYNHLWPTEFCSNRPPLTLSNRCSNSSAYGGHEFWDTQMSL